MPQPQKYNEGGCPAWLAFKFHLQFWVPILVVDGPYYVKIWFPFSKLAVQAQKYNEGGCSAWLAFGAQLCRMCGPHCAVTNDSSLDVNPGF